MIENKTLPTSQNTSHIRGESKRNIAIRQSPTAATAETAQTEAPPSTASYSETYFKDIAPILIPFALLGLVIQGFRRPPSMLTDENLTLFKGAMCAIGTGQALSLGKTALEKQLPEWSKKHPDTLKAMQILSAASSSTAGASLITNAALLKSSPEAYVTPASFQMLGLSKLADSLGAIPKKHMPKVAMMTLAFAMAGFAFLAKDQVKDQDMLGAAFTGVSGTLSAVNLAKLCYTVLQKKSTSPDSLPSPIPDDVESAVSSSKEQSEQNG